MLRRSDCTCRPNSTPVITIAPTRKSAEKKPITGKLPLALASTTPPLAVWKRDWIEISSSSSNRRSNCARAAANRPGVSPAELPSRRSRISLYSPRRQPETWRSLLSGSQATPKEDGDGKGNSGLRPATRYSGLKTSPAMRRCCATPFTQTVSSSPGCSP